MERKKEDGVHLCYRRVIRDTLKKKMKGQVEN
jgi:hypothetical protein